MKNLSATEKKTRRVRAFMRVLFVLFSFSYLYVFQGDLMRLTQQVLSGGRTTYHALVESALLTCLLVLLQRALARRLRLPARFHMLTYVPSFVLLSLLTSLVPSFSAAWGVGTVVLLAVGGVGWWLARRWAEPAAATRRDRGVGLFMSNVWMFIILLIYVGLTANTDRALHEELRVGRLLSQGRPEAALRVGTASPTDTRLLSALRAYALHDRMPERLFEYPMAHGAASLLLLPSDTAVSLFPPDSLYRRLGWRPAGGTPLSYFSFAAQHPRTPRLRADAVDYYLCALLLEKQLDRFARELPRFYVVGGATAPPLPKYYAQALVLYQALRTRPVVTYADAAVAENLNDFFQVVRSAPSRQARRALAAEDYGDTYWWYYFFQPTGR